MIRDALETRDGAGVGRDVTGVHFGPVLVVVGSDVRPVPAGGGGGGGEDAGAGGEALGVGAKAQLVGKLAPETPAAAGL